MALVRIQPNGRESAACEVGCGLRATEQSGPGKRWGGMWGWVGGISGWSLRSHHCAGELAAGEESAHCVLKKNGETESRAPRSTIKGLNGRKEERCKKNT